MNLYFKYPIFNKDSKDIIYTKSDNFFNYNTFWDVVKNPNNHYPIWVDSCENRSVNKELNSDKFDYTNRSFQKNKLRAKDLKIRHINDKFDRYKFISKFVFASSQVSHK
jgi:bifunctional DNase/RNase